ncbi:MAG: hypothetical protein EBX54_11390, partial [Betaproteobacteria bacterium]|nr:hypothetical protein [Betaproteobacteria bacterium]
SGAACVQAADAASQRGMTMASLAPKTLEGLAAILPKFATITNPIDITAALLSNPNLFGDILPVIASDPASDGFIIGLPVAGEGYDMASMAEDAAELCPLAWFETIRGDKSDMKFVLKGCSSQIQHKSELGLVRLDLQSAQAIEAAYEDMLRQAAKVSVQLDGVLIAQQVKARREVMIGARYDPVFGTVILAGDGGLYLEAMPDSVVLLAPFDEQAIRAKLRTLRIAPLLDGVRGEPALDVAAWVQQIQCVAAMMATQLSLTQQGKAKAHLLSIDLNPLMLGAVGEPCMAVDALIWTSDWPCSDSRLSGSEP